MTRFKILTSLRKFDCTKYEPMVRHPPFTRLNNISQLSFVDKVYRGAKQSRLDHSGVVGHFANEITNHLIDKSCISKEDKTNVEIVALIHDIGHMPYSHASAFVVEEFERMTGRKYDHKTRAVDMIDDQQRDREGRTLKDCIKASGGDVEVVKRIILKQDPLSQIISHNTLGADKTGYVCLDVNRTFYAAQLPFFLDIFPGYYYDGKRLGLEDEEFVSEIEDVQTIYQKLYKNVYFHPTVRFYERLFEKALQTLLEDGTVSTKKLWKMEERDVDTLMKRNRKTRGLFERIQREEMDDKSLSIEYDPKKEKEFKRVVDHYSNPLNLSEAERKIAEEAGCKSYQVTCVLSVLPDRIIPEDVHVFSWNESIFQRSPSHYQSLVERAKQSTRITLYKDPSVNIDNRIAEEIILNLVNS